MKKPRRNGEIAPRPDDKAANNTASTPPSRVLFKQFEMLLRPDCETATISICSAYPGVVQCLPLPAILHVARRVLNAKRDKKAYHRTTLRWSIRKKREPIVYTIKGCQKLRNIQGLILQRLRATSASSFRIRFVIYRSDTWAAKVCHCGAYFCFLTASTREIPRRPR